METIVCPKGHQSSDQDYCSECGARMAMRKENETSSAHVAVADAEKCPDCGTVREHKGVVFCEICGYNFMTGARGEVPVTYSVPQTTAVLEVVPEVEDLPSPDAATAVKQAWAVVVSVSETVPQPDSPDPPANFMEFTVALQKPISLVGRTSQTRAIFPDVAIDHDDAVSHRHALLEVNAEGALTVRDIGASNGTMVNGQEIAAMMDHPLEDGDAIDVGHWSRITVKAIRSGAAV